MDDHSLSLPTYYLQQVADELAKRQVNTSAWLAHSGLTLEQINQPEQSISFSQFSSLIIDAMRLSNQPDLGLLVGKRLGLTTHGMLGYAIIASSCLRETIELFSRFMNTRTPLLRVAVVSSEEELRVELHQCYPLNRIKIPFLESAIFTLYNLLMQLTQNAAPIRKLCFPYAKPNYAKLYQQSFSFPIQFDSQTASISLTQSALDHALPMADQQTLNQAKIICEQELAQLQSKEFFQTRVRKYLLSFEKSFPSLAELSNHFHLSQRTLHRRLQSENVSYSNILESIRKFRSMELLSATSMTVQEISFLLGYSDVANYRKAFKRWQGCSPSEFRKNAS